MGLGPNFCAPSPPAFPLPPNFPPLPPYPPSPPTTPSRVPSRPGVSGFAFPSADPTQIFCNAYESSNLPNKPELCDAFCEPVINLVNEVVDAQLMGTQLEATIRMNGLNCMYAFCGAVVFSLILGVVCDYIDDDYRRHREVRPKLSHYIDLVHLKDGLSDDWHLGGVLGLGMLRSPLSFLHLTLLIITLVFEILICVTPMTFRQLGGSLGDELATHGINFDRNYTILQITWLLVGGRCVGWNMRQPSASSCSESALRESPRLAALGGGCCCC